MNVDILGETIELFPQKAVYWNRYGILLLADLHLGKISHFRRSGIAVPQRANDRNIEMLVDLIHLTRPTRVICLGDLFHSHYNPEWEVFGELVKHFRPITFELVIGNHDIMSDHQYFRKGIVLHNSLTIGNFLFTHHPLESIPAGLYNVSGHIHPGVVLRGQGRQSVTLPCFYFGERQAYIPAFGLFTGLAKIRPRRDDRVFVVAEDKIMMVT
ncbi:MAG TPA: ligase-associated DNA damage response endonuclease PdeM [Chryseosolibacter sp.]|nr:ligase-associated DNA damage response endonuclease PdeM [Chryseosolibacter sp.]